MHRYVHGRRTWGYQQIVRYAPLERSEEMHKITKARGNEKKERIEGFRNDVRREDRWNEFVERCQEERIAWREHMPNFIEDSLPYALTRKNADDLGIGYAKIMCGIEGVNRLDKGNEEVRARS